MKSMTGFGSSAVKIGSTEVSCELRSVNHRFFNFKSSLPSDFASLEPEIEKMVRKYVSRGTITVNISVVHQNTGLRVDEKTIMAAYQMLSSLKRKLGFKEKLSFESCIVLPLLWQNGKIHAVSDKMRLAVKKEVEKALQELVCMREREGENLKKDLTLIIKRVSGLTELIHRRTPLVKKFCIEKVSSLLEEVKSTEGGLATEIAALIEKGDITEEIARLRSHISQFEKALKNKGKIGKKLEFLTQEMGREINTIASKSQDSVISEAVIEVKTLLERIREQVENIE